MQDHSVGGIAGERRGHNGRRGRRPAAGRRKACAALVCAAVAAAAVAGCGGSSSSGGSSASASTPPQCKSGSNSIMGDTIGLSLPQEQALFSQLQNDIEAYAKKAGCGWKFKVTNANADPSQQITDAQQLIAQGVNLIWANEAESQGWNSVATQAKAAKVMLYNWSSFAITGANLNATVDQAKSGALVAAPAAAWIKAHPGHADVGVLVSVSDPGFQERAKSFESALKKLDPSVKFVATGNGGFTNPSAAESSTLSMIQSHPDINMIFADWDGASLGAAQAAREAGKTNPNTFYIAGQDGSPEQLALMQKPGNVLQASGAELYRYDAGIIVSNMMRLLLHQSIPPTRTLVPTLVTPANVKQVLKEENDPFNPIYKDVFNHISAYYSKPLALGDPVPTTGEVNFLNTPYTPVQWLH
jgi:ribose transport system substrate-binding protein